MESRKDLAISLRIVAFQERHRIVTALTERHGLISALARNSVQSRRFGGALDLFTASEWIFTQKEGAELANLQEASVKRAFEGLRADFERLSLASVLSELMLRLAPHGVPCPELFRLHSNALAMLEEMPSARADHLALLNGYLAKLLQWSGNQPQVMDCLGCGTSLETILRDSPQAALGCVIADAGWHCAACRAVESRHGTRPLAGLRIAPAAIADFRRSLQVPIRQVPAQTGATVAERGELFRFLEALFVYHLPGFDQKPLKSLRFLALDGVITSAATAAGSR